MKRMKEMRTWKRTAGCFLAAVMTAGLLMGCSTQGGGASQAETNQEAAGDDTKAAAGEAVTEAVKAAGDKSEKITIGWAMAYFDHPVYQLLMQGAREKCKGYFGELGT